MGDDARRHACQHRAEVFPQQSVLAVEGDGKADGGGGEEHIDVACALLVGLIGDLQRNDHHADGDGGEEKGIEDLTSRFLIDASGKEEHTQRQGKAEIGRGGEETDHFAPSFLLRMKN